MKKKKKSNKFLIRRVVAILLLIVIVAIVKNMVYQLTTKNQTKQVRLLFNNEIISLSNHLYVEDSVLYIAEEDIKNIFDDTIYYNVGDKELITTYNKHVAVLHLNEPQMMVNDSIISMQGTLKEIDSKIYLPLSDLGIVYDVETEYVNSTNLVIMNSTTKAKKQAMVLKDTKLKSSKFPFASTKEKVKRGDTIFLIGEGGNQQKVRTNSGNIGYLKNKNLSEVEILREELVEDTIPIKVLEEYSDWTKQYEPLKFEDKKDNVVIVEDFVLEKDVNINSKIDQQSEKYIEFLNWANSNEIDILANLKNDCMISENFITYEERNKIINAIYYEVLSKNYKGICIDFEQIDDMNSFYRFLIELTPKFEESGLKVIVKLTKPMDAKKVKKIVDLTI